MSEKNDKFQYTYAAPTEEERREIESIRKDFLPPEKNADKLARLRKLNDRVKNAAMITSLSMGVIGILLFGLGMSLCLVWENYVAGVIVAALGIAPMAAATPVYNAVLWRGKKKYGEEILRLSEELLHEHK